MKNKIVSSEKNCEELRFSFLCLGVNVHRSRWLLEIECRVLV
jgi:hypothetical protein